MLVKKGCGVSGLGFTVEKPDPGLTMPDNVEVIHADIRDAAELRRILQEYRPDHIYHLAAISNVAYSLQHPRQTYDVNVGGTLNLFEVLREIELRPRIVHVSTAHVYRSILLEGGLHESAPLHLLTPYAASKSMCEALAMQYSDGFGLQIMNVRPFNHVGPGQQTGFVCSDFARQIAAIKLGKAEPVLHVGNLKPVRDFTDVRDVVEAYWTIATRGVAGETYNVSSGSPVSIQQILSMLCDAAGVQIQIRVDPDRFRAVETLSLYGDSARVHALGWKPRIPLEQTLRDTLDCWMTALAGPTG
jgi:GDP-4-dehydro-6-deoxy-D-mannose reductase